MYAKSTSSFFAVILVLSVLIIFSGCSRVTKFNLQEISRGGDFAVATIDSTKNVNASTLYSRLANSTLLKEGGLLDSSVYFDTLKAIVVDSLVAMEARKVDLRTDFIRYRLFRTRFNESFMNLFYKFYIIDSLKVDSAKVDSFYRAHPADYTYKEQVRVRQLVISADGLRKGKDSANYKNYSTEQLDSAAKSMVYRLRERIDSGVLLETLAKDYSMNRESGEKYGDLGYFFRGTFNKEFEDKAFSLPKDAVSQPFKTPDGWHIIQIIDHIDSSLAPLNAEVYKLASQALAKELADNRTAQFLDSITRGAAIHYNDPMLNENISSVPDTTWAATVNDIDTIPFFHLAELFALLRARMDVGALTIDMKREALLQEAQKYLIEQAGMKLGFGNDPAVVRERNNLYQKFASEVVTKGRSDPAYNPPDSIIEDYYQRNIDKYTYKKPICVQQIIVSDSVFGEFLRDQAMSGIDFLDLAKQYYPGAEEIRVAAADLGYIGPGEMPDAFYQAAMATPKGGVSHPVKTEWGFHVIKVVDKKYDKSLGEVRDAIVNALRSDHDKLIYAEWEKEIFDRHYVDYNLNRMKRIELPPKVRR